MRIPVNEKHFKTRESQETAFLDYSWGFGGATRTFIAKQEALTSKREVTGIRARATNSESVREEFAY